MIRSRERVEIFSSTNFFKENFFHWQAGFWMASVKDDSMKDDKDNKDEDIVAYDILNVKKFVDEILLSCGLSFQDTSCISLERSSFLVNMFTRNMRLVGPLVMLSFAIGEVAYPMHINNIKKKQRLSSYTTFEEVLYDLALVFSNCVHALPSGDTLHEVSKCYLACMNDVVIGMKSYTSSVSLMTEIAERAPRFLLALTCKDEVALFHKSVDETAVPGYYSSILCPTSINTIFVNLDKYGYFCWEDLMIDIGMIWKNAMAFNESDEDILSYTKDMSDFGQIVFDRSIMEDLKKMAKSNLRTFINPEMSESWVEDFKKLSSEVQDEIMEIVYNEADFLDQDNITLEVISFSLPSTTFLKTRMMMYKHKNLKKQRLL